MVIAIGKVTRGAITFRKALISQEMLNAHRRNGERKSKKSRKDILSQYTTKGDEIQCTHKPVITS
ncbi:hypothetical protein IC619_015345 [Hazenella sp. IB182353]|uniref:hypothetical protein n=1 Tax=Polycladospora coralii TaxID=2771432 RepID=UPI001746FBF8|nr:hypothetical protein [Polycladospora coralii]MBS7531847.1 hypothetical protein [Polycladospora coralii]